MAGVRPRASCGRCVPTTRAFAWSVRRHPRMAGGRCRGRSCGLAEGGRDVRSGGAHGRRCGPEGSDRSGNIMARARDTPAAPLWRGGRPLLAAGLPLPPTGLGGPDAQRSHSLARATSPRRQPPAGLPRRYRRRFAPTRGECTDRHPGMPYRHGAGIGDRHFPESVIAMSPEWAIGFTGMRTLPKRAAQTQPAGTVQV